MPKFGLENKMQSWIFEYDFAKDGGAVGDITLRGTPLPVGAVVLGAYIDVRTAVTSGGLATVALKVTGAGDILAAAAIAGFAAGALLIGVPDFATVADAVRVATSAKSVVATVAVDTLLTGKFHVHLFGFVRQ
jgi:sugar/nucleoside kinase (ribokinase family)